MADQDDLQGLIVIRRRGSTELEMPKGGVWKIAFADFMTAMMCFFLVMWLINAANEDTRQAVAAYFNPVRLSEVNKKGLDNPHIPPDGQPKDGERTKEAPEPGSAPSAESAAHRSREALFNDPYKVLSEIAAEDSAGVVAQDAAATGPGVTFRDPFGAEVHDMVGPAAGGANPPAAEEPARADREIAAAEPTSANESSLTESGENERQPISSVEMAAAGQAAASMSLPPGAAPATNIAAPDVSATPPPAASAASQAADLGAEVARAVRDEAGSKAPNVSVEETGEGVLISLTDDADFGMFAIGSAEPQPEMVRVMERIGAILKGRTGAVTIRGHTDSRPFRSGNYDNWRLSTDRAQMAYYMLVRGGLDEKRVEAIEGYADRRPKLPSDPESAENRRIEILVREAAT